VINIEWVTYLCHHNVIIFHPDQLEFYVTHIFLGAR
jgi:hypothetical protein